MLLSKQAPLPCWVPALPFCSLSTYNQDPEVAPETNMTPINPIGMAWLVGALSYASKGHRFDPQSGQMPRMHVPSPVGVPVGGNQMIFLSHQCFALSLPLSWNHICPQQKFEMGERAAGDWTVAEVERLGAEDGKVRPVISYIHHWAPSQHLTLQVRKHFSEVHVRIVRALGSLQGLTIVAGTWGTM